IQRSLGVNVTPLDQDDLATGYPWMNVSDLAGGSLGLSGEGWLDAYSLNQAFRKKAISLGAEYRAVAATGLTAERGRVQAVHLADGSTIRAGHVVNAAGPAAATVAGWIGIDLPVRSRKR